MRKIDWTDYRQALEENQYDAAKAVTSLQEKWPLNEIDNARKEFESRKNNPLIEKAMMEENCNYTSGNPTNRQLLKDNGEAIASVIRAGIKK